MMIKQELYRGATSIKATDIEYDEVHKIFLLVCRDHPEIFWLSGNTKGNIRTSGGRKSIELNAELQPGISACAIPGMRSIFLSKVKEIATLAKRASRDTYSVILYVHDYIVQHTEYDMREPMKYNAYGCLVKGRAVCAGYAAAFMAVMEYLGIECGVVSGRSSSEKTGDVSHAWNYVKIGGEYYYIDVTWDDPLMHGSSAGSNLSHEYFCLNTNELLRTHSIEKDRFIPVCSGTRYNYYRYFGMYIDRYSLDAVKRSAQAQLLRKRDVTLRFSCETDYRKALDELGKKGEIHKIMKSKGTIFYTYSDKNFVLRFFEKG